MLAFAATMIVAREPRCALRSRPAPARGTVRAPGTWGLRGALILLTLVGGSGCGATLYQVDVLTAEAVGAEAEQAGAADLAPYEYYAAREYLAEAHHEASEAAYEDALRYAQIAGRLGREARRLAASAAREPRRGPASPRDLERGPSGDR